MADDFYSVLGVAKNAEKKKAFINDIRDALYASKIVSYAQGYMLMRAAAKEYGWNLNYGGIALMWRGGCIIRSRFLGKIKEADEDDIDATYAFTGEGQSWTLDVDLDLEDDGKTLIRKDTGKDAMPNPLKYTRCA